MWDERLMWDDSKNDQIKNESNIEDFSPPCMVEGKRLDNWSITVDCTDRYRLVEYD